MSELDSPTPDVRSLLAEPDVLQILEDRARKILGGRRRRPDAPETQSLVNRAAARLLAESRSSVARPALKFEGKDQLIAYLVNAMRWVLIDLSRRRRSTRRGGDALIESLGDRAQLVPAAAEPERRVHDFFAGLERLRARRSAAARVAELRHLLDFTWEEVAAEMQITPSQARSEWDLARAFLLRELKASPSVPGR